MKEIIIARPKNDSLVAQLESLYKTFINTKPKENLEFNLSLLDWACPLSVLPVSAYINNTRSNCKTNDSPIKSYLQRISFPEGIDSISVFQQRVQRYKSIQVYL